jgi:lysozyme family protein
MRGNFERALAAVLVHEGGYVNHPKDPGGATNKGVTQRVYDDYRLGRGLSPAVLGCRAL